MPTGDTTITSNRIGPRFWRWTLPLLTFSVVVEFLVRWLDLWSPEKFPTLNAIAWMDKVMHLLWGANVFWICLWLFRCRGRTAWALVLAWQIIWESGEMLWDIVQPNQPAFMIDHLWPDGVLDTLMDLLGGLAMWLILTLRLRLRLPLPGWRRAGQAQ